MFEDIVNSTSECKEYFGQDRAFLGETEPQGRSLDYIHENFLHCVIEWGVYISAQWMAYCQTQNCSPNKLWV